MSKTPIILYRKNLEWEAEEKSANKYFKCIDSRTLVKSGDVVIPRFSALPFYKELENDVNLNGATLVNTYQQHRYAADLSNWVNDLNDLTPKTWYRLEDLPETGPFVLKGETNSKKFFWKTSMFAENKKSAIEVAGNLYNDSLICYQNIYIRQYIPLVTYMVGIQDLPITKEFRFFCYKGSILSGGYYWASHSEDLKEMGVYPNVSEVPVEFLNNVINIVKDNINFYTIDVAQTQAGNWIVIEIGDATCCGLSDNDPEIFYRNLAKCIF